MLDLIQTRDLLLKIYSVSKLVMLYLELTIILVVPNDLHFFVVCYDCSSVSTTRASRMSWIPKLDRSPTPPFLMPSYADGLAHAFAIVQSDSSPNLTPSPRYDKRVKQYLDISASESD